MDGIDYSPLGKAIGRLNEGLEALRREPENTLYRDAVIQRFEFTYGLCASMLKRHLAQTAAIEPERDMTFPTLIRTASENGLVRSGWDVWFDIRKARNLTSHIYNEEIARQVVELIPTFAEEAEYLYRELERTAASNGN
ncbi:MAG: nucleotidyltransferase substrate binding protein [Terracidiphilus sp.]|jgi:nucleotidyltransferase substrate binding protein (TIGR01987 family)